MAAARPDPAGGDPSEPAVVTDSLIDRMPTPVSLHATKVSTSGATTRTRKEKKGSRRLIRTSSAKRVDGTATEAWLNNATTTLQRGEGGGGASVSAVTEVWVTRLGSTGRSAARRTGTARRSRRWLR